MARIQSVNGPKKEEQVITGRADRNIKGVVSLVTTLDAKGSYVKTAWENEDYRKVSMSCA
jgi:hypothetical protein